MILWTSKKQELITLLIVKAEYVAASHTTKEALWLHRLLYQLMPNELTLPTTIYCNNQATIKLIKSNNCHSQTKHIEQWYLFMHNMANKSVIDVVYSWSEDQVANVLTKALSKWKAALHADALGMHHTCRGCDGLTSLNMANGCIWSERANCKIIFVMIQQVRLCKSRA
jgi:hypothetical protein